MNKIILKIKTIIIKKKNIGMPKFLFQGAGGGGDNLCSYIILHELSFTSIP
jgi:hypothetical protein